MIKNTFLKKGIVYASQLALQNVNDLEKIVKWNHDNDIKLYRMSSSIFPWMSEYEFLDLPDIIDIWNKLKDIGTFVREKGQRLTFHPGPFNVLPSPTQKVITNTIKELRQHAEIMDMMALPKTPYAAINIHIGGTYGDKQTTLKRFRQNFHLLSDGVQKRLVIENDDKDTQYTIQDLYNGIYEHLKLPITFDYLHHICNSGDLTEQQAIKLASKTWPNGIRQLTHYSSSRQKEDTTSMYRAHADYIHETINTYGLDLDIELEAKAKDLSVLQYLNKSTI